MGTTANSWIQELREKVYMVKIHQKHSMVFFDKSFSHLAHNFSFTSQFKIISMT